MTPRPDPEARRAAGEALALRMSHPHAPALDVLDLVMPNRTGTLTSVGAEIEPATPFGFLLAEAFDTGMAPEDWRLVTHPNTPPGVVAALRGIWTGEVVPKFAKRYGLTP